MAAVMDAPAREEKKERREKKEKGGAKKEKKEKNKAEQRDGSERKQERPALPPAVQVRPPAVAMRTSHRPR